MKKGILKDIQEYTPSSYEDFRGELFTTWKKDEFKNIFGIDLEFVHDKTSVSKKNVLRGIHGDSKSWKLMICNYGELYYVVVDNRPDSPTYKQWDWDVLTAANRKMLLIPPGFGSSFYVMSDLAVVNYKWAYPGAYPDVEDQFTLSWNSPELNIHWPTKTPILSERDA
jgi:dTDP-4-dehydrorhamnose 3,5-epimerase